MKKLIFAGGIACVSLVLLSFTGVNANVKPHVKIVTTADTQDAQATSFVKRCETFADKFVRCDETWVESQSTPQSLPNTGPLIARY